jgi:hypothetical protein
MSDLPKVGRSGSCGDAANTPPDLSAFEKHFSVEEIAKLWNVSVDTVRRIFEHEPGVLVVGDHQKRTKKRRYRTLRIPESVVERVHRKQLVYL